MKKIMVLSSLLMLFIWAFTLQALCQEKLDMRARIWDYGAVCEFKDPPLSSGFDLKPTTEKVTLEVTNCKTFEQKQGHPAAVVVTFKNRDTGALEVPLDKDLADVFLSTKDSQITRAIAKRAMVEGPMGGKKMEFITRVDASYVLKLQPGQEVNIVYLFPKAEVGDTIKVCTLKPIKVE